MKQESDTKTGNETEDTLSLMMQVMNLLPGAVNIKDRDHVWVELNDAFARISEYPRSQLIGKTSYDILPEADAKIIWEQDDEVFRTKSSKRYVEHLSNLKGHSRWVEIQKSYFQSEAGSEYVITVLTDLTELKDREQELIAEREKSINASRARATFLANMGSDIRDPMNAISEMSSALKATDLDTHQAEILNKLQRSGDKLFRIIDDIMDFSKMDAGLMKVVKKPFDPNQLIENIAISLGISAREKRLDLISSIDADLPEFVLGDASRIRQILLNIAENAIKFTSKGYVHLSVSGTIGRAQTELVFCVRDTGPGMPKEALRDVVADLQDDSNLSDRSSGVSGLGLSLCRKMASLMGGKLEISSTSETGTEVKLRLTLANDPNCSQTPRAQDLKPILPHSKILIVDDIEANHHALLSKLKLFGLTADYASSAKSAASKLAAAHATGMPYTLVFVDYLMPNVDGLLFVNLISQNQNYQNVEIIALSSVNDPEVKSCFTSDGLANYLVKPVRGKELEKALRAVALRETLKQSAA